MAQTNMTPGGHLGTPTSGGWVPIEPGTYYMTIQKPSYYKKFMEEYKYRPDNHGQPLVCSHQILKTIENEYPDLIDMLVSDGMTPESAKQYINRIISITLYYSR